MTASGMPGVRERGALLQTPQDGEFLLRRWLVHGNFVRDLEGPAGGRDYLRDFHAGMDAGKGEFLRDGVGRKDAEIGDDRGWPPAGHAERIAGIAAFEMADR